MRPTSIVFIISALAGAVVAAPIVLPPGTHVIGVPTLPRAPLPAEAHIEQEKRDGYAPTWKKDAGVKPAEDFGVTWKRDSASEADGYSATWKRQGTVTWKRDAAIKASENFGVTWKRDAKGPVEDFGTSNPGWKREEDSQ